jgi:hypothetical protein
VSTWSEDAHPRASAGTATGGQFAADSGGSASSSSRRVVRSPHAHRKAAGHATAGRKAAGKGTLGFDTGRNTGTGYGTRGGDKRVHLVQQLLIRLGVTDGKGRRLADDGKFGPLTTQAVKKLQTALGQPADGKVTAKLLAKVKTLKSLPTRAKASEEIDMTARTAESTTEAVIGGTRTFAEIQDVVRDAIRAEEQIGSSEYIYVCVVDMTDEEVIYSTGDDSDELYQRSYSIDDAGHVEFGEPTPVVRTYMPASAPADDEGKGDNMATQEAAHDRISGRVLEAKGTDEAGGRVFNVRIIAFGDSRNGRRYPARVMQGAVSKYEGARAYDHHRTAEELRSSTLTGLIGSYRNVEARSDGLYGDLHLLPGATHAAEALDATLAAQEQGRPPIVGVSHDVMAHFQPINNNGRRLQEATQIVDVQSADVVANPSAGGLAMRAVAGGTETEEESDVPTKADVLAAFKEATDDELAAVGLARAPSNTTESVAPPTRAVESGQGERTTEAEELRQDLVHRPAPRQGQAGRRNLTPATEAFIVRAARAVHRGRRRQPHRVPPRISSRHSKRFGS